MTDHIPIPREDVIRLQKFLLVVQNSSPDLANLAQDCFDRLCTGDNSLSNEDRREAILSLFPRAQFDADNDGQLVVYTNTPWRADNSSKEDEDPWNERWGVGYDH